MDGAEPRCTPSEYEPPVSVVTASWASAGAVAEVYRGWGWAVTVRGDQVCLDLDSGPGAGAVAVVIPAGLADQVVEVLAGRRCAPAVLAHPGLGSHRVIVAGERFGVLLSWPPGVHRVTGALLLPPTPTAHGPVRWLRPPGPLALRLCREVDICAALSTVLHRLPTGRTDPGLPRTAPTAVLRPEPPALCQGGQERAPLVIPAHPARARPPEDTTVNPTLAPLSKGRQITGPEREQLAARLRDRYAQGASIRDLVEQTGRSYGWTHRMLRESGAVLRGRGGAHPPRRSPPARHTDPTPEARPDTDGTATTS